MNSIVQSEKECYFTQRTDQLERHHIFFGAGRRKLSDKYGLTVWLTHDYHNEPPWGVHHNKERRRELERIGQQAFQERFPDKDFRQIFGQNYL